MGQDLEQDLEALPGGSPLPCAHSDGFCPPLDLRRQSLSCSILTTALPAAPAPGLQREVGFVGASDPSPGFLHTSVSKAGTHTSSHCLTPFEKKNLFITIFEQNLLVFQTDDA